MKLDSICPWLMLLLVCKSSANPMPTKRPAPHDDEIPIQRAIDDDALSLPSIDNLFEIADTFPIRNPTGRQNVHSPRDKKIRLSFPQTRLHKNEDVSRTETSNNIPETANPVDNSKQPQGTRGSDQFKPGRMCTHFPITYHISKIASLLGIPEKRVVLLIVEEYRNRQKLNHPNLLQCSAPIFDYKVENALVKYECFEETLKGKLESKNLSENEAKCNFWQLLSGLDHMHSKNVAHRNIKPESLVFKNSGLLKIGDFGFLPGVHNLLARKENEKLLNMLESDSSKRITAKDLMQLNQIPNMATALLVSIVNERARKLSYAAPEMFKTGVNYDQYAADIWASAITFIGSRTFRLSWSVARQDDSRFKSFQNDPRAFLQSLIFHPGSNQGKFSEDEVDTLLKMLELDPSKRITAKELMQLPWIQNLKSKCPSSVLSNYQ